MSLNISMREKILLFVLGLVAICFLGIQFLIMPAADSLGNNSATLMQTQVQVAQAQADVAQAKNAPSSLSKALSEATQSASGLLPSLDKPSLHIWIFGIAKDKGLTVKSAVISDPISATPGTAISTGNSGGGTGTATNAAASSEVAYNLKTYAEAYTGNKGNTASSSASTSSGTSASSSTAVGTSGAVIGDAMMVSVDMEMTGTYAQANAFLDAVKKTKRYVSVSGFSYKIKDKKLTFDVTLQCYAAQKLDSSDNLFNWALPVPSGQKDLM
jgi:Tfp pilus assembly protein PilO